MIFLNHDQTFPITGCQENRNGTDREASKFGNYTIGRKKIPSPIINQRMVPRPKTFAARNRTCVSTKSSKVIGRRSVPMASIQVSTIANHRVTGHQKRRGCAEKWRKFRNRENRPGERVVLIRAHSAGQVTKCTTAFCPCASHHPGHSTRAPAECLGYLLIKTSSAVRKAETADRGFTKSTFFQRAQKMRLNHVTSLEMDGYVLSSN